MIDHGYQCSLGPIDRSHQDQMRSWRNDPRIYTWCRQDDLISDLGQLRWFESQSVNRSIRMYSIYDAPRPPNQEPIPIFSGVCGFTSIDCVSRRAEFSIYVSPEKQGTGLGKNALLTLIKHGFCGLGFHLIWGEVFDGNPALRLFKDVGFIEEGIRRGFYFKSGKFIDAHLISMTEKEWRKKYLQQPPADSPEA